MRLNVSFSDVNTENGRMVKTFDSEVVYTTTHFTQNVKILLQFGQSLLGVLTARKHKLLNPAE